jgi:hypothetical protein
MNPTPYEDHHDEQMAAELSSTIDGLVPSDQEAEETLTQMSDMPPKKKMSLMTVLLMGVGLCVLGAGGWVAYGQYQQKMKSRYVSPVQHTVPGIHSSVVNKDLPAGASAPTPSASVNAPGAAIPVGTDTALPGIDPQQVSAPAANTLEEKAAATAPDVSAVAPIKADAPVANEKKADEIPVQAVAETKLPALTGETVTPKKVADDEPVTEKPIKVTKKHTVKKSRKHVTNGHRTTVRSESRTQSRDENVVQSQQRMPDAITAPAAKKPDAQFWSPIF